MLQTQYVSVCVCVRWINGHFVQYPGTSLFVRNSVSKSRTFKQMKGSHLTEQVHV